MKIDERLDISKKIQKYDFFFRLFWDATSINWDSSQTTACINFDKNGKELALSINPDFWKPLNEESKCFVICHELLHVMYEHGKRMLSLKPEELSLYNIAADVVINHTLVDYFDFSRDDLVEFIKDKCCWLDTVFPDTQEIICSNSTEYYYNLLKSNTPEQLPFSLGEIGLGDGEDDLDALDDFLESIDPDKTIIKELAKKIVKKRSRSTDKGNTDVEFNSLTKKKIPWESVIKNWTRKAYNEHFSKQARWDRPLPYIENAVIPSEPLHINTECNYSSTNLLFFLDLSGSCSDYFERFAQCAYSIDRKIFNTKFYAFDTKCVDMTFHNRKSALKAMSGGTEFQCIVDKVSELSKTNSFHNPEIFILTDGYAPVVEYDRPSHWHWFISGEDYPYITKVPKSHYYDLTKFS